MATLAPLATARRQSKDREKQRAHELALATMRGDRTAAETKAREQGALQQMALRHMLGQTEEYGTDAILGRQRGIMAERRAESQEGRLAAAETQREKLRPLEFETKGLDLQNLKVATQNKEDVENMMRLKRAMNAGQDPSTIKLIGIDDAPGPGAPGDSPGRKILGAIRQEGAGEQKRQRLIAESRRFNMAQGQKMIDSLTLAIARLAGKRQQQYLKKEGIALDVRQTTPEGAGKAGEAYGFKRKDTAPARGRGDDGGRTPVEGQLDKPSKDPYFLPALRGARKEGYGIASPKALRDAAGKDQDKSIRLAHRAMGAAYAVSKIRNPEKRATAEQSLLKKYPNMGDSYRDVYFKAKNLRRTTLNAVAGPEVGGTDFGKRDKDVAARATEAEAITAARAKGETGVRVPAAKKAERAGLSRDLELRRAGDEANGLALKEVTGQGGRSMSETSVKSFITNLARREVDREHGIKSRAEKKVGPAPALPLKAPGRNAALSRVMNALRRQLGEGVYEQLVDKARDRYLREWEHRRDRHRTKLLKERGLID